MILFLKQVCCYNVVKLRVVVLIFNKLENISHSQNKFYMKVVSTAIELV